MQPPKSPFFEDLPDLVAGIVALPRGQRRQLVAIAGLPAGGKSTLSETLTSALRDRGINAANIPMDGYHLDNRILELRDLKQLKGAPETFDAAGFISLMQRLKAGDEVVYPVFDRRRDIAIAGAEVVPADCDLAIVEGNYLLFGEAPWNELSEIWNLSVWVETREDVVLDRCVRRWLDHGHTTEAAHARALGNDVANARRINTSRLPADITIPDRTLSTVN